MSKAITITYDGKTLTFREWAVLLGISVHTIRTRYHAKMTPHDILSKVKLPRGRPWVPKCDKTKRQLVFETPFNSAHPGARGNQTFLTIDGEQRTVSEWAFISGVPVARILARLKKGAPPEEAIRPEQNMSIEVAPVVRKAVFARRSMLSFEGRMMTVEDWARTIGLPFVDLLQKLNAGEPVETCLKVEPRRQPVRMERPQATPARPRIRVPTLAELDALREAA